MAVVLPSPVLYECFSVMSILENALLLFSGHMDTDIISLVHYAHCSSYIILSLHSFTRCFLYDGICCKTNYLIETKHWNFYLVTYAYLKTKSLTISQRAFVSHFPGTCIINQKYVACGPVVALFFMENLFLSIVVPVVNPDNTFEILVDNAVVNSGSLLEDVR